MNVAIVLVVAVVLSLAFTFYISIAKKTSLRSGLIAVIVLCLASVLAIITICQHYYTKFNSVSITPILTSNRIPVSSLYNLNNTSSKNQALDAMAVFDGTVIRLTSTSAQTVTLPALTDESEDQYKIIRINNEGDYLLTFTAGSQTIIMGPAESITLSWTGEIWVVMTGI
jgi:glucan phosphoethanolaminetransferase (alkaline phosphatase superfamily)